MGLNSMHGGMHVLWAELIWLSLRKIGRVIHTGREFSIKFNAATVGKPREQTRLNYPSIENLATALLLQTGVGPEICISIADVWRYRVHV